MSLRSWNRVRSYVRSAAVAVIVVASHCFPASAVQAQDAAAAKASASQAGELVWEQVTDTPWKPRHAASVFVFDNALWMVAGNNMERDVWKLVRTPAAPQDAK